MRGFSKLRFFVFPFLFCAVAITSAQNVSNYNELRNPQNRLKFGNYLFCSEDYLRAVYEYREALTSVPGDTIQFKIAYAFSKMGRYSEAADNFKSLFFNFHLADESKFEYFKIRFLTSTHEEFRNELLASPFNGGKYASNLERLSLFSHLIDNSVLPDSGEFVEKFESEIKDDIQNLWSRRNAPDSRDPLTAAILSAVIPGAGKVYTENYGDAVTAFLFTGLLTYAAIDNYSAGHKTRTWVLGSLAALFYGGNVYGSYSSAQIFNAKVRFDFERDVFKYLEKWDYFSPVYKFLCGEK